MCACTRTHTDLSRWKSVWIARLGADQPPRSSLEQKLEEGKKLITCVLHSRSLSSILLIPNNCWLLSWRCWMRTYPLSWTPRILRRAGTRSNRLSSPPVKACKCDPASDRKKFLWSTFQTEVTPRPHRCLTVRQTPQSTYNTAHTAESFLWAPRKVSHICLI